MFGSLAAAHHSIAGFDNKKEVSIRGTVVEFRGILSSQLTLMSRNRNSETPNWIVRPNEGYAVSRKSDSDCRSTLRKVAGDKQTEILGRRTVVSSCFRFSGFTADVSLRDRKEDC